MPHLTEGAPVTGREVLDQLGGFLARAATPRMAGGRETLVFERQPGHVV